MARATSSLSRSGCPKARRSRKAEIAKRVESDVLALGTIHIDGRKVPRLVNVTSYIGSGGLLPLSLFGGPLWAPMTNGMIFGLLFATPITLVLVPVMCAALTRSGPREMAGS